MLHLSRGACLLGAILFTGGCRDFLAHSYDYGSVAVTVRDLAGASLAGVAVGLYSARGIEDTGATDADGNVNFSDVPFGSYAVAAAIPDGYRAPFGRDYYQDVLVREGQKVDVALVFSTLCCGRLRVVAVDSAGVRVPQTPVSLYVQYYGLARAGLTDSQGTIAFESLDIGLYLPRAAPRYSNVPQEQELATSGVPIQQGRDTTVQVVVR